MQRTRLVFACAVTVILVNASARAQSANVLMERVGDWVHEFVEQFANVVAEEDYVPLVRGLGSRLRSDYLLVRYPGSSASWLTFRDVVTVDGNSLRNQPERLAKLFLEPFDAAVSQADAISRHSARYISPLSDPLLGISVLQRQYHPRFRYTAGDLDHGLGPGIRRIKFEETGRPTILRDGSRDLPTHGIAWVLEASGRVVRTEVEIGERSRFTRTVVLTTAFKMDDALRVYVPVTMVEGFTMKDSAGVKGTAYYTRFRRFSVRTVEKIDTPKP